MARPLREEFFCGFPYRGVGTRWAGLSTYIPQEYIRGVQKSEIYEIEKNILEKNLYRFKPLESDVPVCTAGSLHLVHNLYTFWFKIIVDIFSNFKFNTF